MVTWTCEISGEPLDSTKHDVVVTPSGHVCQKKLLLQKMSENGGLDPFLEDVPLEESALIALSGNKTSIIPPRTSNSVVSTMNDLHSQYDSLILELFDTRKLLQSTQQELSQSLYQNDAAVRVISRLLQERDQAREQLLQWKAGGGTVETATATDTPASDEPAPKKTKLSQTLLPESDHQKMLETWNTLQPNRKAKQKELASLAVTSEQLQGASLKTSNSKLSSEPLDLSSSSADDAAYQVVGDSLVGYSPGKKSWSAKKIPLPAPAKCSDVLQNKAVVGLESGTIQVLDVESKEATGTIDTDTKALVDVRFHPDAIHVCACSSSGVVTVANLDSQSIVGRFASSNTYTAGALHPDGLIYVAGDDNGTLHLLDFKSQALAGVLSDSSDDSAVVHVDISNNGYHIGVVYANATVKVWDLRKQSVVHALNEGKELTSVSSIRFDASGKYVSYSGNSSGNELTIKIVTAKKWQDAATLTAPKLTSHAGLQWGDKWIAASGMEKNSAKLAIFEA